jgi:phosphosulfolactate phosphohydrolase-like enzyme
MPRVTLSIGEEGAHEASARGDVVVIVDALRASTTIVAALTAGMRAVRPVATAEECVGEVTAGEHDGVKLPGVDIDNSPTSVGDPGFAGKELVLTTTNGTRCILAAASHPGATVLVGALTNAAAAGRAAGVLSEGAGSGVTIVIAGNRHRASPEDHIAATAVADAVPDGVIAGSEHVLRVDDPEAAFLGSPAGLGLAAVGRTSDIRACAQRDTSTVVPILRGGRFVALTGATAGA